MAFTEFYVQTTGDNLNAGSTTADAASLTYASGNWAAATGVFTVASGDPTADGVAVGDFASVYPDGSTVAVFVGRVTARDTTTITVSLSAKMGTAPTNGTGDRTLKIGGAWKGPNGTVGFPFTIFQGTLTDSTGHYPRMNIKGGTNYDMTSAAITTDAGSTVQRIVEGYTTSPGDGGFATIDGGTSGASYVLATISGNYWDLKNLILQNNGATGSASGLVVTAGRSNLHRVIVYDVRGNGIHITTTCNATECETYACNQSNTANIAGFQIGGSCTLNRCIAHHNIGSNTEGFRITGSGSVGLIDCISHANGRFGFDIGQCTPFIHGCDAYDNVSDGLILYLGAGGSFNSYIENCNFFNNGGYGINGGNSIDTSIIRNCAFGAGTMANTSGDIEASLANFSDISGTVTYPDDTTPWVDPDDGDFRISASAGKGTGRGKFLQTQSGYGDPNPTLAYPDIGAAQHLDSGGGDSGISTATLVIPSNTGVGL